MKLAQILAGGAPAVCALTNRGLVSLAGSGYHAMTDAFARPNGLAAALRNSAAQPIPPEEARFLPVDFKKGDGFLLSIRRTKELGLYRQSYCGCEFSKMA